MNCRYDGSYCKIVYKIKAQIEGRWFHKKEFELPVIGFPMPSPPLPFNVAPTTENLKFCCCFDRGTLTFGAAVDDTRIARGEDVKIAFSSKNQSTAEIEHVSAVITESIWWRARGRNQYFQRILSSKGFQKEGNMTKMSKDELKNLKTENNDNSMKARAMMDTTMVEIYDAIQNGDNVVSLRIPQSAKHTFQGSCCGVSHELKIKVKTTGGVTNPSVSIPIQIGTMEVQQNLPGMQPVEGGEEEIPLTGTVPVVPVAVPVPSAPPAGWEPDVIATPVIIPNPHQVYIAPVKESENEIDLGGGDQEPSIPTPVIVPNAAPSLSSLKQELQVSISASSTVKDRIEDEKWKDQVFSKLTPQQFVSIIRVLTIEFDKAEVAAIMAPVVNNFSCEYIVTVIRSVSEWMRVTMVKRLIPYAKDLRSNSEMILVELSDWEKLSTQVEFDLHLNKP